MVNINDFKNFVDFISNKVQRGNSVTPRQFNEAVNRAQFQVFEKDRGLFIIDEIASDFLKSFLKRKIYNGPFASGEMPFPDDYQHTSSVRSYYVKKDGKTLEVEVLEVKNADWGEVRGSSLYAATLRFPKFSEFKKTLRVLPINVSTITLEYFATPVKAVWAFTVVNDRPVYDAANSTDLEWDEFAINNVAAYYLQLIGVNLKDTDLLAFTQQYKQETNSVL